MVDAAGTRRQLKVLHVVSSLGPRAGGPSKAAVEMCQALAERGVVVELYATDLDGAAHLAPFRAPNVLAIQEKDASIGGVETRYFRTRWPHRFAFSPAMASELRRRISEFDVVHVHSLYLFPTLVATRYARRYGVPYIMRPHGTLDPYLRRRHRIRKAFFDRLIERSNLNHAAAIHYTSTNEREMARPLGISAPPLTIPLGIRARDFASLPAAGSLGQLHPDLKGKRLIVFLGRIARKKGLDLLVQAFAVAARQHQDIHLVIAGPDDENYGSTLRAKIRDAGVIHRSTILGMVAGHEKLALLADAHIWVLPSYTENFGLAAVEAMACGRPIVISNKVDIHREVRAAGAGMVVSTSCDEVAKAICRLLDDQHLCRQIGHAARQLASSRFTWEQAARQLIDAYEGLRRQPALARKDGLAAGMG